MLNKNRIATLIPLFLLLSACGDSVTTKLPNTGSTNYAATADTTFPIGVFEDGNLLNGNTARFQRMIDDLKSHDLNAVMFDNNFAQRDAALLNISDEMKFDVYMLPGGDLNVSWWPSRIPANQAAALKAAGPVVSLWKSHPSLKGYITADEPGLNQLNKVRLIDAAFHDLDPTRPAMPILVGVERVNLITLASRPDVLLMDVYPAGVNNPACDFTMTGFGYSMFDFVNYIRAAAQNKPPTTPLWLILQTHSFQNQLREPTRTEVREQNWLAIGEGAKGIFWFIYSSQQGWKGLVDNQPLYDEVASLARRTNPLRDLLLRLQKQADLFSVSGTGSKNPYVSTLRSNDNQFYVVAVNRDCQNAQNLSISSPTLKGQLKDLETSSVYRLDTPIAFPPGDGKIFEFVP